MNNPQKKIYQMSKICYLQRLRYPNSVIAQCTLQSTYKELKSFYKHATFEELRMDHDILSGLK